MKLEFLLVPTSDLTASLALWREYKATKSCEQCGEAAPECLHFHHVDPATKSFDLGT